MTLVLSQPQGLELDELNEERIAGWCCGGVLGGLDQERRGAYIPSETGWVLRWHTGGSQIAIETERDLQWVRKWERVEGR